MAHTYILFDFGTDEEKAQLARHKLEGWKQAFRLDKKLQFKFDRADVEAADTSESEKEVKTAEKGPKTEKLKAKGKGKEKPDETAPEKEAPEANGKVGLLVRLYFSTHEKLSEQRWVDRIPVEEPFKNASPRVIRQGEAQFDEVLKQFESLE